MPDYNQLPTSRTQPIERQAIVIPSNSSDLQFTPRAIMTDEDQVIAYIPVDSSQASSLSQTFLKGVWTPVRMTRVLSVLTGSATIWIGD